MVEAALNAAAEQVLEASAYGNLLGRMGNRSPAAVPQGLYPCAGSAPGREQWLALSVATDVQWASLVRVLGRPAWALVPELANLAGRRAAHDAIDAELRPFFAARERERLVAELLAAGVPAAPVADPRLSSRCPQHQARGLFEEVAHPVIGVHPLPTLPFRYRGQKRWLRAPAPTLGQHNREILAGLLGMRDEEIAVLESAGIVGTRPRGR